jgi:tetratricopeptide (TPR) repeat protein
MSESKEDQIARLLREGLDHYGFGETSEAIRAWKQVLSLDPGNPEAVDYIKTSDRRQHPRQNKADRIVRAVGEVVAEAQSLIESQQLEESLELLHSAAESDPFNLKLAATIELVRSRLVVDYRKAVGDLSAIPVMAADPEEITKFNLPPDAGFLLSMIDGATSVESLISLTGMDTFDALRTTKGLLDAEIVSMRT